MNCYELNSESSQARTSDPGGGLDLRGAPNCSRRTAFPTFSVDVLGRLPSTTM